MLAQGHVQFYWLELDGKPAAAEYQLVGDGVLYAYQAGVDPDAMGHQPGKLINLAILRRAIERGYRAFDFLRGDEPYKARFGAEPRPQVELHVVPRHALARLRHSLWLAGNNVKDWIKKEAARGAERGATEVAPPQCAEWRRPPNRSPLWQAVPILQGIPESVMPLWKRLLLILYYHGTYPVRLWNYRQHLSRDHLPVTVLLYHRIADDRANPWTVSNAMFLRQIRWLRERFHLISLAETQQRIRSGRNTQPCVSITFDDGYADNCRQAVPLLIEARIPCTYFVTVQNVLSGEPFSHDLMTDHRFAPNTLEELRSMAAAGIEIGAHAYTHTDLGPITDPYLLQNEVVTAKTALEESLGRPVRYFAFPYGQHANLSPAAFALAKQAGYSGVCSAYGGFNFPGDDAFHLQRVGIDDDMIRLKHRVTLDPRKLHTPRFVYRKQEDGTPSADDKDRNTVAGPP